MALDASSISSIEAPSRRRRTPSIAEWGPLRAVGVVVLGLALGLGAAALVVFAIDDGRAVTAASGLLTDIILLAVVVAFAARRAQRLRGATLGLRRTSFWPALGWSAAVLAGVWLVEGLLAVLLGGGGSSHSGRHAAAHFDPAVAVLLVGAVAVSAPIVEEIAFRGYLFPALTGWRGPWVGAVVTAILFGAGHVLALPPAFLAGAAVFGFGACLLRWFTGSLLPGIAVHSFNNAIVLAALSEGQLLWAIPVAPLLCLALVAPFSATRAEDVEAAVAAPVQP
ncbi:MAG: Abortive infection protein [Conexibacter sp.]|nr:Abortive infection protein [Conexibacter sp.]